MKADTTSMGTEISYDELMGVYAPLWVVSMMIQNLQKQVTGDNGSEILAIMEGKLQREKEPLKECMDRIEKENPDQFS